MSPTRDTVRSSMSNNLIHVLVQLGGYGKTRLFTGDLPPGRDGGDIEHHHNSVGLTCRI